MTKGYRHYHFPHLKVSKYDQKKFQNNSRKNFCRNTKNVICKIFNMKKKSNFEKKSPKIGAEHETDKENCKIHIKVQ